METSVLLCFVADGTGSDDALLVFSFSIGWVAADFVAASFRLGITGTASVCDDVLRWLRGDDGSDGEGGCVPVSDLVRRASTRAATLPAARPPTSAVAPAAATVPPPIALAAPTSPP